MIVWGLPCRLSFTFSVALRDQAPAGVKLTLIVQLAPTFRTVPQVFPFMPKSPPLAPVIEAPLMVIIVFPVFVRVTMRAAPDESRQPSLLRS